MNRTSCHTTVWAVAKSRAKQPASSPVRSGEQSYQSAVTAQEKTRALNAPITMLLSTHSRTETCTQTP